MPSAVTSAPSHDTSVMPTVVENRQGLRPRPPFETAESKVEAGGLQGIFEICCQ